MSQPKNTFRSGLKDSKFLASCGGSDDFRNKKQEIKIWDINKGTIKRTISVDGKKLLNIAISPNNRIIATSDNYIFGNVTLWNFSTGNELLVDKKKSHNTKITSLCFINDEILLSGDKEGYIYFWNCNNGQFINKIRPFKSRIIKIIKLENGFLVCNEKEIKIFNFSGNLIKNFSLNTDGITDISVSSNEKYIAVGNKAGWIKLFEYSTKKEISSYKTAYEVSSVSINPESNYLASTSSYYEKNETNIYDIINKKTLHTFNTKIEWITAISYSRNILISSCGLFVGKVKFFNLAENNIIPNSINKNVSGHYNSLSADNSFSKIIITSIHPTSSIIWDLNSKTILKKFKGKAFFSSGNKYIINVGYENIQIFDNSTNNLNKELIDTSGFKTVTISRDEQFILTGNSDKSIKLWDINNGKIINTYPTNTNEIQTVAISPKTDLIAVGDYNYIKIYDKNTSKKLHTFKKHSSWITSLIFSNDSKYLISASQDKTIKVWDIKNNILKYTLTGHELKIDGILFYNDSILLSNSWDGSIRFWNINNGKQLLSLYLLYENSEWVATTPDGFFDGTDKGIEILHYVNGMEIIPLESYYDRFYTPNLIARVLQGEQFKEIPFNIQDALPKPTVKIISPIIETENQLYKTHSTGNLLATREIVNIEYIVTDNGGGINEIRIYQNGSLIETDDFVETNNGITKKTTAITLLRNSKNIIRVTAYNEQRTEAIPQEITIYYEGVKATSNLFLFCVGINDYQNSRYQLNYAKSDAESFMNIIQTGGKNIYENIHTYYLYDKNVTKEKIINTFNEISKKAEKEDVFIFYYSGHSTMSIPYNNEPSLYYLVLSNITQLTNENMLKEKGISAEELSKFIFHIKTTKKLIILDACQSGGVVENILAMKGIPEEEAIIRIARAQGVFIFASSSEKELGFETGSLGHGVFTYTILQALSGEADYDNNKNISIREIEMYLHNEYPKLTAKYSQNKKEIYPITRAGKGQIDFPLIIVK